jgi:hypothetical protein
MWEGREVAVHDHGSSFCEDVLADFDEGWSDMSQWRWGKVTRSIEVLILVKLGYRGPCRLRDLRCFDAEMVGGRWGGEGSGPAFRQAIKNLKKKGAIAVSGPNHMRMVRLSDEYVAFGDNWADFTGIWK